MVLKVKSSTLFFYPKLLILVTLRYCSDFKVKKTNIASRIFNTNSKGVTGRYTHQDVITMPFIYTLLKTLNGLSVRSPSLNQIEGPSLKLDSSSKASLTLSRVSTFHIRRSLTRFTVLRAPYRYKKGRYQIGYKPHTFLIKLTFNVGSSEVVKGYNLTITNAVEIQEALLKCLSNVTTNVCNLTKIKLHTSCNLSSAFQLKGYTVLKRQ